MRAARQSNGRFAISPLSALQRFAAKCNFDPATGCVVWIGATTAGHGNSARYGAFWDEGQKIYAHRWSAANIHGFDITGVTVGHCCPHTGGKPNTLCVEHVKPETLAINVALGNQNRRIVQNNETRQFWLFVALGIEPAPAIYEPDPDQPLFYRPPPGLLPPDPITYCHL